MPTPAGAAGLTGAAGADALFLAACGDDDDDATTSAARPATTTSRAGASGDLAILNYALTLEYLEAAFYDAAADADLFKGSEVRARMVVDAAFRREVETYGAVREALLDAPPPEGRPDAASRAHVMDVVRREAELFAAAGRAEPEAGGVPSARRRLPRAVAWLRRPRAFAALAVVLVAVVVAGAAIGGLGSDGGSSGGGRTVVVGTVLGVPPSGARGEIAVVDGGDGEIRISGFPAAGAGREYQVWTRSGQGDPRPTTVPFVVDRDGGGRASIPARTVEGADELLLTSEPRGGSPAPTRDPVLRVAMPA